MPWAVVTGASSGIGTQIAKQLAGRGYDIILASRRTDRLELLCRQLAARCEIVRADLSNEADCRALYEKCAEKDVEILVNNAGFGAHGNFSESELSRELEMIDVNVRAVHILTKLFLKDFVKKDRGRILNVASAAGFLPAGPLMAAYYATKAYVLSLTRGISKELERSGSAVTVSALCPGPVMTEFNEVAGVKFAINGISAEKAAEIAVRGLLKGKKVIVPGTLVSWGRRLSRLVPDRLLIGAAYKFQSKKGEK